MRGKVARRVAKSTAVLLVAAAVVGVAAPSAGQAPLIAPGVTVAGLPVGAWDSETARNAIRAAASRPLLVRFHGEIVEVPVQVLGASFAVDEAVSEALNAQVGADVPLTQASDRDGVREAAARLARRFRIDAVDARLVGLRGLQPVVSRARAGRAVRTHAMELLLRRALRYATREPVPLLTRIVHPRVTRKNYGAVIVIARGSNQLRLYRGPVLQRSFRVATGSARYPTPSGSWSIVTKQRFPWWRPPASDWAKGLKPVPPGPGNPLGTRWMGLSAAAVGIHGTPDAASIGYSASHGCIRMRVPEAEWLFERVEVGTPVVIV